MWQRQVTIGNDNADTADYCPASNSNVFTVSALDENNFKSYYSNYGHIYPVLKKMKEEKLITKQVEQTEGTLKTLKGLEDL